MCAILPKVTLASLTGAYLVRLCQFSPSRFLQRVHSANTSPSRVCLIHWCHPSQHIALPNIAASPRPLQEPNLARCLFHC
jgi:hypothetical protein